MKNEIWKSIPGYNGLYEVSSLGNVKSLKNPKRPKILSPGIWQGYRRVSLHYNKKPWTRKVARLVLITFKGPCFIGYECAHLNGRSTDDRLINLIWATHKENIYHRKLHNTVAHGKQTGIAILSEEQVREIKMVLKQNPRKWGTLATIARKFNVVRNTIWAIDNGKSWGWLL